MTGLKDTPVSTSIWSPVDLRADILPPVHSLLFGAFRIVDAKISIITGALSQIPKRQSSFVDVAFGADDGFIAGVHRFSVAESKDVTISEGKRVVTITFAHISCNPREDAPLGPEFLQTLHLWYAMLLFREGVTTILSAS